MNNQIQTPMFVVVWVGVCSSVAPNPIVELVYSSFSPSYPTGIAKHFRYGSQEDAHEFLRYTVDAMQKSCLPGTK